MSVQAVQTVSQVREVLNLQRKSGRTIGLVPTMGALHAGHARLIETARKECGFVAVSIFVNPLQFGPGEDYAKYPAALQTDLEICRRNGTDLVFAPSVDEMYPVPQRTFIDVSQLSEHLCGVSRPGHFRGVATVVLKLFNILSPHRAYFGEKDFQQLAVIRRMVLDLNIPVEIVGVPTVRQPDGLALSSRNQYLNAEQRKVAPALFRGLEEAVKCVRAGEKDPEKVRGATLQVLRREPSIQVEYVEIVDPNEIQPVVRIEGPVRIAGAIWLGSTRLIDNLPA